MTSTPCQGEALGHLVAPWAEKIARSSGTTVEAILTHAGNVRAALHEPLAANEPMVATAGPNWKPTSVSFASVSRNSRSATPPGGPRRIGSGRHLLDSIFSPVKSFRLKPSLVSVDKRHCRARSYQPGQFLCIPVGQAHTAM